MIFMYIILDRLHSWFSFDTCKIFITLYAFSQLQRFGYSYIPCVHTHNSDVWFSLLLMSCLDLIWDIIENNKKQEMAVPTKVIRTVDKKSAANCLRFVFLLPFLSNIFWLISSWWLIFVDFDNCSSVRSTVDLVDLRIPSVWSTVNLVDLRIPKYKKIIEINYLCDWLYIYFHLL